MSDKNDTLSRLLDENGKLKRWPRKDEEKRVALDYIAYNIDVSVEYSEKQINDLIKKYHTFDDWALLRREMCMRGMLLRTKDGSVYKRSV